MKNWYAMVNKGEAKAEISIYDEIGFWGVTAKDFINELNGLGDDLDEIDLHLNTPGGEIIAGNAIYNALKNHKAKINVFVDGIAASMGSVIAMAGDTISIAENAFIMIHNPFTMAWGEADELRSTADRLDQMKAGILSAYSGRTGKDAAELSTLMDDETWMMGSEAVDLGFADEVTDPIAMAASFNRKNFDKVPDGAKALMDEVEETQNEGDTDGGEDGGTEGDGGGSEEGATDDNADGSESREEQSTEGEGSDEGGETSPLDIKAELKARMDTAYDEGVHAGLEQAKISEDSIAKDARILELEATVADVAKELNLSDDKVKSLSRGMDFNPEGSADTKAQSDNLKIYNQWDAIEDPAESTAFYQENEAAINAGDEERYNNEK